MKQILNKYTEHYEYIIGSLVHITYTYYTILYYTMY